VVISGKSVVLCDGDHLIDAVRNGQGVLNVLPLANVKQELDARIIELKRSEQRAAATTGSVAAPLRSVAR
jgi:hypothetical protein